MTEITVNAKVIIKANLKSLDLRKNEVALRVEQALNSRETMTIEGHGRSRPYVGVRFHFHEIEGGQ